MSNLIVWTNNASSLLASSITSLSTTVVVTAGQGALFPAIAAGQYAVATLEDTSGNIEIVYVTGRTSDTMTITRAQEGTSPLPFASGSRFELRVTAGVLATLLQKTGADILSGTTTLGGVLTMNGSGSIQNGEIAGAALRGAPGLTANQILIPSDSSAPTVGGSPILSTSNIVTHMPAGAGLVITGMVLFWTGASNAIPSGYVLCDGTNGTPDLRDKFIVGGGGSLPTSGGANTGSTGVSLTGATGGATALTIDQIPGHSHKFFSGVAASGNSAGKCPDWGAGGAFNDTITAGPYTGQEIIQPTGGATPGTLGAANSHTHTLTDPGHSHTVTLPPYRAVFAIMKT
jgi:hypothetical protein